MKSNIIIDDTIKLILSGKYGKSGDRFPSVRTFMEQQHISFKTALKIYKVLEDKGYLFLLNKVWTLCFGICQKDTPLYKYSIKKKLIGIHTKEINNPYISENISLIKKYAQEMNFNVIISTSENNEDEEKNILKTFIELGCIGVINFPSSNKNLIHFYDNYPLPMVTIGRKIHETQIAAVQTNNYEAGCSVANYLYKCNYKIFYFIGLENLPDTQNSRFNGFNEFLISNNINKDNIHLIKIKQNSSYDYIKLAYLFKNYLTTNPNKPIGVFCINDIVASELIISLNENKISIPDKVGIVGYDNLPISIITSPTITTIDYSYSDLSKNSLFLLTELIKTRCYLNKIININNILYIRESTANLN